MNEYIGTDQQLGELLRRQLPVPEHRDGFQERVAAQITAAAAARAAKRGRGGLMRWRMTRRSDESTGASVRTTCLDRPRRSHLRIAAAAFSAVLLLAGVGVGVFEALAYLTRDARVLVITDDVAPSATLTAAEIRSREVEAIGFSNRLFGAWPDPEATLGFYADDATIYDPSDDNFGVSGKKDLDYLFKSQFYYFPKMRFEREATYLSADAVLYAGIPVGLWPPALIEPADHPPVHSFDVFRLKDGLVASEELWFSAATLEMVQFGVFAPGGGGSGRIQEIAKRYLEAWSSGNKDHIAALYSDNAVFSDSLLSLQAQGPRSISALSEKRFGSAGRAAFQVIDLYAQVNGSSPPTVDKPEQGAIIGVAIHYRCTMTVGGQAVSVEAIATLRLGTLSGGTFALDPDGLITREEVFYDGDSLIKAGFAR